MTSYPYKDKVWRRERKKKKMDNKKILVRKKDNFRTSGLLVRTLIYNVRKGANTFSRTLSKYYLMSLQPILHLIR